MPLTRSRDTDGIQTELARPCGIQVANPVLVEPLARSTGHQSWFVSNLATAIAREGVRPVVVTFDGMHDVAGIRCQQEGCEMYQVSSTAPLWLKQIFSIAGIAFGGEASPSRVRWEFQMYLHNLSATVASIFFACRMASTESVIHLLCPPSRLAIMCLRFARRPGTRVVITTFAGPKQFYRRPEQLARMCRNRAITIVVQTEALADAWRAAVGVDSVRMIPLPSEELTRSGDQRENRLLLGLGDGKPIVAVIGCITPRKGYLELFQAIRPMRQDFRVLLIGDTGTWITPDPSDAARAAGWEENTIIRRKFVPEHLMPNLFGAVDVVALLYREANGSSGILSLCQRYGVPVLATCFGEIGAKVRIRKPWPDR